jgi:replicative DNA helicase
MISVFLTANDNTPGALPANIDAERAILGAIMFESERADDLLNKVKPTFFLLDSHRKIAQVMVELRREGKVIDLITLPDALKKNGWVESVGGAAYIYSLTDGLPWQPVVDEYINIVQEKSMLRGAIDVGQRLMNRAVDTGETASNVILSAQEELLEIEGNFTKKNTNAESQLATLDRILEERKGVTGRYIPAGIHWINKDVGGLVKGELTFYVARPKVGKSAALRRDLVVNCRIGNFCHYMTGEMTEDQVRKYLLSQASGVPFRCINHPETLNQHQVEAITKATHEIVDWPLRIDEIHSFTAEEIVSLARVVHRQNNTQLFGLDYIQKVNWTKMKTDSRWNAISETSALLLNLAQKCNMAVVAISALTEGHDSDLNEAPNENCMRGSGDLKFDANTMYIFHRGVDAATKEKERKGVLITALSRNEHAGVRPISMNQDLVFFE